MEFKSLIQLLDYFKDEKTCIQYYENIRWGDEPACPHCGSLKPYKTKVAWKCRDNDCNKKFSVKVGTIFENSKLPMRTWLAAIFLATSHKKGISSVQLSEDLGITQKTAWFVMHRIREMLKQNKPELLEVDKVIEADETYVGAKEKNKHFKKRKNEDNPHLTNDGSIYKEKRVVLGLIQRDGKVILKHAKTKEGHEIENFVKKHVPKGSTIYTDEYRGYRKLKLHYSHETIKHKVDIYVDGNIHTNTMESFWSVFKRGLMGIYHQVSEKHLERYLDEFSTRFNARLLGHQDKIEKFLKDSESYLSYKRLVA